MSSGVDERFDQLHVLSQGLENGVVSEDNSEVQVEDLNKTHVYDQHVITARGARHGVPVVVSFQKHYFYGIGNDHPELHNVFEVFTTANRMPVDATIRRVKQRKGLAKLFAPAHRGIRGNHALYTLYEVAPVQGRFSAFPNALNDAFLNLLHDTQAEDFHLQAGAGLAGVYSVTRYSTVELLSQLLEEQLYVSRMIG